MYNSDYKRQQTAGVIRYSCGFLFLAFVFCYLAFLRGDVLAEIQFVLSKGLTHYSVFVGAFIITAVLQILQLVISKIVRLPAKYYVVTYVPSFIALAMLIGMDQNMDGKFVWSYWRWLLPVLLSLWFVVLFIFKRFESDIRDDYDETIQGQLWPNYLMMLVMIFACGFVSNTPSVYQYELKTERKILAKDYEDASNVGKKSLESTVRLTQLRMYALSKQGILGDSIFAYPQYYGTKGLLNIHDNDTTHRFPMQNIEFSLGGLVGKTIRTSRRFLERLALEDTCVHEQAQQYLLCYHLLNKNLGQFDKVLHHVYGDTIRVEIPKAYQEALIMQHEYPMDYLPIYINKVYVEQFADYRALRDSLQDEVVRRNLTRKKYGKTYWWYFDN